LPRVSDNAESASDQQLAPAVTEQDESGKSPTERVRDDGETSSRRSPCGREQTWTRTVRNRDENFRRGLVWDPPGLVLVKGHR
jgi:hypothetical protein